MDNPYQAPQGRLLPTLALFFFILTVLYALFLFFEKRGLAKDIDELKANQVRVEAEMALLQNDQIESLAFAQDLKDRLNARRVIWSKIVSKLEDLTPVGVFFTSYGASKEGSLQLTGLADTHAAVTDALAALDKSKDFDRVFSSSLTLGTTNEGQQVVSFSLNLDSKL